MPTIFRRHGFRFYFYSNDHLPVHVHIEKDNCTAKFNLEPLELIKSKRFDASDLKEIRTLVEENKQFFKEKWDGYFNS